MARERGRGGLVGRVAAGAALGAGGTALYGVIEACVNAAHGLHQPIALWAFAVAVYAIIGLVAGAMAGLALAVWERVPGVPKPAAPTAFLAACFLGGFLFVFIGLPFNQRVLPNLLSASGILGNAALMLPCAALTLALYVHLRRRLERRFLLSFALLALSLSLLLAIGMQIDTFVRPLAPRPGSLLIYGGLLAGCVLLYLLADRLVPVAVGTRARRALLATAALIAALFVGRPIAVSRTRVPPADGHKPNIVWVVMDTVRADHLSAYGYPRPTTPNLDALAADGVLFENVFGESSWTAPTHYVMITSSLAAARMRRLDDSAVTAPEILGPHGYDTGAVLANMVLGRGSGFTQGWDWVVDGPVLIFYQQLFERLPVIRALLALDVFPPDAVIRLLHHRTYFDDTAVRSAPLTDWAIDWIERRERPFFLFVNYMDAHDSYDPPSPFREKFAADATPELGFVRYSRRHGGSISSNRFVRDVVPKLTPDQWKQLIELYDAEIASADHQIGRILHALEERGIADNTIVVVTADHGELFGEHGLANHFKSLSLEETHVPLIVRYPAHLPAGRRVARPAQLRDILPSILELAGIDAGVPMDGHSLVAAARGTTGEDDASDATYGFLVRDVDPEYWFTSPGSLLGIRTPREHYVWSQTGKHEYYDRTADPREQKNLYGGEQAVDVTAADRQLQAWRQAHGFEHLGDSGPVDRLMKERLKAIGYAD
jgi:arylsulfatase A-like enzyme